jgi:hypothetical protein
MKNKKLNNSIILRIELLNIELTLLEIWLRPWMQSITIFGIASDNFMFNVLYISREEDINYNDDDKKFTLKFEFFGIKNFKEVD